MEESDSNTTVTLQQLAELADIAPNYFHRHPDLIPLDPAPLTGEPGRPQLCVPLARLVEYTLNSTAHLTDAECRLRVALTHKMRKAQTPRQPRMPGASRLSGPKVHVALQFTDDAGCVHCFSQDEFAALSPEEKAVLVAACERSQAAKRSRRTAQTTLPLTTPEGDRHD